MTWLTIHRWPWLSSKERVRLFIYTKLLLFILASLGSKQYFAFCVKFCAVWCMTKFVMSSVRTVCLICKLLIKPRKCLWLNFHPTSRCLRLVNKDINNYHPNVLQYLPSYIKRNILKYATGYLFQRLGRGFKDDEALKALLDKEVMNLDLTNSVTTDYTLTNISEICSHLRELIFGGPNCTFTEIGEIFFISEITSNCKSFWVSCCSIS